MSRRGAVVAVTLAGFALAWSGESRAADAPAVPEMDRREHRDGLVFGMGGGWGFASSSGYPNNAQFIDVPKYHAQSGAMFGSGGTFFIEGALADYVNFGFWFGGGSFANGNYDSSGGGAGIRVEGFPLYYAVPSLRDLGIVAQFGVSGVKLAPKHAGLNAADGAQSFLGVGAFYEWTLFHLLGGHFAAGPSLDYDVIASRSLDRGAVLLGGRFAFYGGM